MGIHRFGREHSPNSGTVPPSAYLGFLWGSQGKGNRRFCVFVFVGVFLTMGFVEILFWEVA